MVHTITIVSLSSGMIGEQFVRHEMDIGLARLKQYGVKVKFAPHALDGMEILNRHPEYRAQDLLDAFRDEETDMILCAIGGDDTYRLLPYLFEHDELKAVASDKIFLGFSDTTINHLMLHKVGLKSFYGQAFLPDVCELGERMLPYTGRYFEELLQTGMIREIRPSDCWYDCRTYFGPDAIATCMPSHENEGFVCLQGEGRFCGEIFGGCLDSLYDIFDAGRYADSVELCKKYSIFPDVKNWRGRILLLETSEEQAAPEKYEKMLKALKATGIFDVISGMLIGKPADEKYADEYKALLVKTIDNPSLPIVWNLNVGHATPRCIVPFGIPACVDVDAQRIVFFKE